jgi:hypothetical protein
LAAGQTVEIVAFDTATVVAIGIHPDMVHGTTAAFSRGLGPVTLTPDSYEGVITLR